MLEWNLDRVIPLMLESGRIALSYFDYPVKEFKADQSIVTIADRSIEDYLAQKLDLPGSGCHFLGEETIESKSESYFQGAFQKVCWIADPIDGTAPFSNNLPNWGVSLGFMDKGKLREGVVFLAALGELYYTDRGKVYREKLGTDPDLWLSRPGVPVELRKPEFRDIPPGIMIAISQQLARFGRYKLPFYVQVTGSSVYNMVKLASGSFGALVTKFKIWDFAGALPMLMNLGWAIEYHKGGAMSLTMDQSTIQCQPGHPDRWSTHDQVIFAPSPEAAEYVRKHTFLE